MGFIKNILEWAKKNERHISTFVYIAGFVSDIFTFVLIPVSVANLLFLSYLGLTAVCIVGSYFLHVHGYTHKTGLIWRAINIVLPLGVQYFIGNLLSGFLIFYTKSAFVFASWPFLLVLALIFIGNEFFRDYRTYLAFQTSLFFFSLYAYAIFALPLFMHGLGPIYFLGSTALSIAAFFVFLGILALVSRRYLFRSLWKIGIGITAIIVLIVGSYFTEFIPPIPLTLTDVGIYHSITKTSGGYEVQSEDVEAHPWWQIDVFRQDVIHTTDGTVSVYSAVFAPVKFGTYVAHRWEQKDPTTGKWIQKAQIVFPMSGGRDGGYRGYSTVSHLTPGQYRVSIETVSGQVIGRISFEIAEAPAEPALHIETK